MDIETPDKCNKFRKKVIALDSKLKNLKDIAKLSPRMSRNPKKRGLGTGIREEQTKYAYGKIDYLLKFHCPECKTYHIGYDLSTPLVNCSSCHWTGKIVFDPEKYEEPRNKN